MYTECPSCSTLFKVTTGQLKTAAGKVRCGRCNTVFNALERLSDELPEGVTSLTEPASESLPENETASSFDDVAIPGMDAVESPETVGDDLNFDLGAGLDDLFDEPVKADDSGVPDFNFDDEPAPEATAKPAEDSFFDLPDAQGDVDVDLAATDLEPPKDTLFGGLDEDMRMPSMNEDSDIGQARKVDREKESRELEPGEIENVLSDDPLDAVHQEFSGEDEASADAYVLEELSGGSSRSSVSILKNLLWVAVIVALLVVLVGQFIYFKRADLAHYPTLKPWLEKMCAVIEPYVSCDVPAPTDLEAIKILDKDVRSHPKSKNALLITATVENEAKFEQPFPMLELSFSDINDKVMARRQFQPNEYLDKSVDTKGMMPMGVPLRMMLEIVDPGVEAVNFEFTFKPRSVQE